LKKLADPEARELDRLTAHQMGNPVEDDSGVVPGEVRARGQVAEEHEPEPAVMMVREDVEIEVESADVEAHRRQGFKLRSEMVEAASAEEE
jgi:hypothetical protein